MATDFNNNNTTITISGGIKPTVKDTPGDVRTRVNTYADMATIPYPYIGMKVTVKADETNNNKMTDYIVKSLKANSLGVSNMVIDEVARYVDYLGISSSGGSSGCGSAEGTPRSISHYNTIGTINSEKTDEELIQLTTI